MTTILEWIAAQELEVQAQTKAPRVPGAPMKPQVAGRPTPVGKTMGVHPPPPVPGVAQQPQAQPFGQEGQVGPDGKVLPPAQPTATAKNMAEHVANHVQDPLGSTKEMFDNLQQRNLEYETAKDEARRQLLPVKQVIQHVEQTHDLNPDEQLGWQDPNSSNPQQQPGTMMPPGLGNTPGSPQGPLAQMLPQKPAGPGIPPNMAQTPGQVNMNRPSQAGFAPGVSPGPQQAVRPGKMGQPQPGQANPADRAGSPRPGGGAAKNGNGKRVIVHVRSAGDYGLRGAKNNLAAVVNEDIEAH